LLFTGWGINDIYGIYRWKKLSGFLLGYYIRTYNWNVTKENAG
jgi:hypothetical protein